MKTKLILSTHNLATKTASLLRSYCHLLKPQLQSQWIINHADERGDVLITASSDETVNNSKARIKIILSNCSALVFKNRTENQSSQYFQLPLPISSIAIINLFNKISKLNNETSIEKPHIHYNSMKGTFLNFISRIKLNRKQNISAHISSSGSLIQRLLISRSKTKIRNLKVVFLGRPAVGKTTAITSISETKILTTEVNSTDSVSLLKRQTTIGIDFGEFKLNEKINLRLFGTPGQRRYDFVQHQTIKNGDIYIILININSLTLQADLSYFNALISQSGNSNAKKVIALTHADENNPNIARIKQKLLSQHQSHGSIMTIDPRSKIQVQKLLEFAAFHKTFKI